MQLLKDERQINEQAGQGSAAGSSLIISKIDCPNCGSPIPYVEGATDYLVCPACHSESKLTGSKAEIIEMHAAMQHFDSTLPLGAKARISATDLIEVNEFSLAEDEIANRAVSDSYHDYVVIGIMRLNEVGEFATWTEYLLYSLTDGFLWLSEESRGWFVARVLSEMPVPERGQLLYDNKQWRQVDSGYRNRVTFAMGAFNWKVKTDDSDLLIDYVSGDEVITSEQTEREITYTRAKPISYSKLEEWFGSYLNKQNSTAAHSGFSESGSLKTLLIWHTILQVAVWLLAGGSLIVGIIAAILIYIVYFRASESEKDYVNDEVETGPFNYHSAGAQGLSVVIIVIALIVSFFIGAASRPAVTGPNPDEEATRGSGGIIIPGGVGGGNSNSNGRTGYSSGGSHK